jgi:hypothetical protein
MDFLKWHSNASGNGVDLFILLHKRKYTFYPSSGCKYCMCKCLKGQLADCPNNDRKYKCSAMVKIEIREPHGSIFCLQYFEAAATQRTWTRLWTEELQLMDGVLGKTLGLCVLPINTWFTGIMHIKKTQKCYVFHLPK